MSIIYILNKAVKGTSRRDFYEKKIKFKTTDDLKDPTYYYYFNSIESDVKNC